MELTKEEKELLKLLVDKEMKDIEKDKNTLSSPETPFFSTMIKKSDALAFIKNEERYIRFLKDIMQKLS